MRLLAPIALAAALLATPAIAEDCRPYADRFMSVQDTMNGLMALVQARAVWNDEVTDKDQPAFATLKTAAASMLPTLQRYIETGKRAVPVVADCAKSPLDLPAGQFVILQSAVVTADSLVPLLVRYLVAYDAATGGPQGSTPLVPRAEGK